MIEFAYNYLPCAIYHTYHISRDNQCQNDIFLKKFAVTVLIKNLSHCALKPKLQNKVTFSVLPSDSS